MRFFMVLIVLLSLMASVALAEGSVGLGVLASTRLSRETSAIDMTGFALQTDYFSNTLGLTYSTNWVFGEKYTTSISENTIAPSYREKYGLHDITLFYGIPLTRSAPLRIHVLAGIGFFVEKLIAYETYQDGRFIHEDSTDVITTTTTHAVAGISLRSASVGVLGVYNAASNAVSVGLLYYW